MKIIIKNRKCVAGGQSKRLKFQSSKNSSDETIRPDRNRSYFNKDCLLVKIQLAEYADICIWDMHRITGTKKYCKVVPKMPLSNDQRVCSLDPNRSKKFCSFFVKFRLMNHKFWVKITNFFLIFRGPVSKLVRHWIMVWLTRLFGTNSL